MIFRALAALLLVIYSNPASSQTLPELPTIGQEIAPFQAQYELAKAKEALAQRKYELAQNSVASSNAAYDKALAGIDLQRRQLRIDRDRTKLALDAARAERVRAEEVFQRERPARGQAPSERFRLAQKARELAERDESAAEQLFENAESRFLANLVDPLTDQAAARAAALTQSMAALTDLAEAEQNLVAATNAYAAVLLKYPPPFLKSFEVQSESQVYYFASWHIAKTAAEQNANHSELLNIESQLRKDLSEMDATLAEHSELRSLLAKGMQSRAVYINQLAEEYGNAEKLAVVGPVAVDALVVTMDVFLTGGTVTAATKAAELSTDKAIDQIVSAADAKITADALSKATDPSSQSIAQPRQLGALLDSEIGTGSSIVMGDTIEALLNAADKSAAGHSAAHKIVADGAWGRLKAGRRVLGSPMKLESFNKALKGAAPTAIPATIGKVIIARIFKNQANRALRNFVHYSILQEMDAQSFNTSLQRDREMIELRKRYRIALADVQYRILLGSGQPTLRRTTDNAISKSQIENASFTAKLTFSQPLSAVPIVKIGDQFLVNLRKTDSTGSSWNATVLSGTDLGAADSLQIFVATKRDNTPYPHIDGNPRTTPRMLFNEAKWADYEPGADGYHRLKLAPPSFDLTGYWRYGTNRILYFAQEGASLTSRHTKQTSDFVHYKNEVDFTATIAGDQLTGRHLSRLSPSAHKKCPVDMWVNIGLTVNEQATKLTGFRQAKSVDLKSCVVSPNGRAALEYTRMLDDEGNPLK